jgi:hypothetical protein
MVDDDIVLGLRVWTQENVEIVGRIWDTYVDELNDPGLTLSVYDQGLIAPDSTYTPDRQARRRSSPQAMTAS